MQGRVFVSGGDAHETNQGQIGRADLSHQRRKILRQTTCLLRFLARIDLDIASKPAVLARHFARQGPGQLRPVDNFDDIEQRHGVCGALRAVAASDTGRCRVVVTKKKTRTRRRSLN